MEALKEKIDFINKSLDDHKFGDNPETLYEPIKYILKLGGKRLRPILVLLGYQLFERDRPKWLVKAALSTEVFHNFTLMHDDIMDKAPKRRGKKTVHKVWNEETAILSGDVMLVKAYELLMDVPDKFFKEALKRFNQCATEVCEGQQLDMEFESRDQVSINEYLDMIRLKTAVLLGYSLELGGLLSGAGKKNASCLKKYGELIGIGFQLRDDLLDVYGDEKAFGKQVGGDIISNKKTYLLLYALNSSSKDQKQELQKWIDKKDFDPEEKVNAVKAIYDELDIKGTTDQLSRHYFEQAFSVLESLDVSDDDKAPLIEFTNYLIERQK